MTYAGETAAGGLCRNAEPGGVLHRLMTSIDQTNALRAYWTQPTSSMIAKYSAAANIPFYAIQSSRRSILAPSREPFEGKDAITFRLVVGDCLTEVPWRI